jgi:hypothetical protein
MTIGQLDFHGREVQEIYANIPGLGLVPIASLFPDGQDVQAPEPGEVWEVTLQLVNERERTEEKHDKEGFATGVLTRVWDFKAVRPGLGVTGVYTRAQKDEQFKSGHGAA